MLSPAISEWNVDRVTPPLTAYWSPCALAVVAPAAIAQRIAAATRMLVTSPCSLPSAARAF